MSWDKHQQTFFPSRDSPYVSDKQEISADVNRDWSSSTNTQHRTNLVQIGGRLATQATGSYAPQDSSCVERASWLLRMPFWLEPNYIFPRTSHFCSWSTFSGHPTSLRYHHLFTSTAANHASTNTSARWEWRRIEQNDWRFIRYATHWDPNSTQMPLSSLQWCKCGHPRYDSGRTVKNCL